jgi:hypothetical protein
MAVFHLVAMIPPGSVQAEIGRLQADVFGRFGLASSQALPPLMPVQFINAGGSDRHLLEQLDGAVSAPWRMTTGRLSLVEGHLFLGVDSMGVWASVRGQARQRSVPNADALFPAAEGFFLGRGGAVSDPGPADPEPVLPVSFSSCAIVVIRIEAPRGAAEWWREVYWEVLEQRPLRGRRKG